MMRNFLVLLFICVAAVHGAVTIINSSPTALPGDIINIQGEVFAAGSSVQLTTSQYSTPISVKVVNEGNGMVQVQLPMNIPVDKYSLVLTTGGQSSAPFFINKATVLHAESLRVCNGTKFRLFGRNLYMGVTPAVVLQNADGLQLPCQVDTTTSNKFVLTVITPASLQSEANYTIYVSNNLGGAQWSPLVNTGHSIIGCNMGGSDAYNLKVPWAGFFKNHKANSRSLSPSGTLKDSTNIQDALNQMAATNKPGEVVLAAGEWGLDKGIAIPSNVVLRGASTDTTVIKYNHVANSLTGGAGWVYFYENGVNQGIADLSFVNAVVFAVNGETNPLQVGQNITRIFLKGINWNMNVTKHAFFSRLVDSTITDCKFKLVATASQNGNIFYSEGYYAIFKNNEMTYDSWGLHFLNATNTVIENNIIHRDAGNQIPTIVTHGFAVSFASNIYFANNLVDVVNGKLIYNNDGETFLSEGGGPNRGDIGAGKVTGATSTTIQDSTQNWSKFTTNPDVAITSGPGMGQHRRIVSNTATTLTIEYPWTITPTSASTYSFGPVAANWTVYKNHFINQERGVWLFMSYMYTVAIDSNLLENSEGISVIAYTIDSNGVGSPIIATWMYDMQVTSNTLTWEPSATGPRATLIGVNHDQVRKDPVGSIVIGTEIRSNSISYLGGGTRGDYNDDYTMYDGYQARVTNQYGSTIPNLPFSVIGTIFQNNKINSFYSSLVLSDRVAQTVVAFQSATACTVNIRNVTVERADRTNQTDTNWAMITSNYNVTLPTPAPSTSASAASTSATSSLAPSSTGSASSTTAQAGSTSSKSSATASPTSSSATTNPPVSSANSLRVGGLAVALAVVCFFSI